MKKINFEAGTQVSPAKVIIDDVEHSVTPAVWEGNTPLSPHVLNLMQDNIENEIDNNSTRIATVESDVNNLEANSLISKETNSTQGSWKPVTINDGEHFVVLVITGPNYTDCKILPISLIKKYSASSPLRITHNGTIIVQIAWSNNGIAEYIWTTGYSITHYAY